MATSGLMRELLAGYTRKTGLPVSLESVGGVDAARRLAAGELFDLVVLASDAIGRLADAGVVDASRKVALVRSGVGVAVHADAPRVDISTEQDMRRAVLEAGRIAVSTGPSGVALLELFARWGIAETIRSRLVQAPPGVPVGAMVARREATLGFQQMSELMGVDGIALLGPLPPAIQITTTFQAAPVRGAAQADAVLALMAYLVSGECGEAKLRHGMEAA
jgi:molybdate transport system substrate-binding protein